MKIKQALAMQSIRNLAAEIDGDWEPERKPLPVDPPGRLAVAGRIAVSVAAAVMVGALLLFGLVGCNSRQPCCCESRPICEKSGGVCDCRYCNCESTCPGQCAKKCCEPRKAHIINPDGTQEHRPLTPDEEEQLRPMTVEEFEKFKNELRKHLTPHWEDGRWEVEKRWPGYPFVRFVWTWDGRKDEPTIYMEAFEKSPPPKPPRFLPEPNDELTPGTKNNL